MHTLAIACLVLLVVGMSPCRASAQEPGPLLPAPAAPADPLEGWILIGVDAGILSCVRVMAAAGYLSGFDSRIALVEGTFVAGRALHLLAGQVRLSPIAAGASPTSILRAGGVWRPVRERFTLDNRLLIERRSTNGEVSTLPPPRLKRRRRRRTENEAVPEPSISRRSRFR